MVLMSQSWPNRICCLNLPASGVWNLWGRERPEVISKCSQLSLWNLLPYRKSILGLQVVVFAFWSFNNFIWRLSTPSSAPGRCSKMTPSPLQNTCFSVRGGFPSQEEMFLWVSPFCSSVCDMTGTLLVFSWRRTCCSNTTLFPLFFSMSDVVNIWHSVCLSLQKNRENRDFLAWGVGMGFVCFHVESPERRTMSDAQ